MPGERAEIVAGLACFAALQDQLIQAVGLSTLVRTLLSFDATTRPGPAATLHDVYG